MLIGYDNGVFGGIINGAPFQDTFHHPSAATLGTMTAIYEVGCCAGALLTIFIGDRLGRRRTICLGAIVMLGGAGFQAGVSSVGAMIGARIVSVSGVWGRVTVGQALTSDLYAGPRHGCDQLDRPRPHGRNGTQGVARAIRLRTAVHPQPWYLCCL